MKKVLLVLSTSRESAGSMERAIELAKNEQGELIVLFVLDSTLSDTVAKKLSEEGWIGGDPSNEVLYALHDVYMLYAEDKLKEIEEIAEKYKISYETIISEGNFEEEVLKVIHSKNINTAILTRRKRSQISRVIFGSAVENIRKKAGCEIELFDE